MKLGNMILFAAFATFAAACSKDNDNTSGGGETPTDLYAGKPVAFTTSVTSLTETRGSYAPGILTEGSMGVFFTTPNQNLDPRFNTENLQVTYNPDSGTWETPDHKLLWKSDSTLVEYVAYMPCQESFTEGDWTVPGKDWKLTWAVPEVQTAENLKEADFLSVHGSTTAKDCGGILPIKLTHTLSQLKISLTKGSELSESINITEVKLVECCAISATVGLDGSVSAFKQDEQIHSVTLYKDPATDYYECILPPQNFLADGNGGKPLKVTITADNGKTYTYLQQRDKNSFIELKSGYSLTLPIQVGRDKVAVGETIAEAWEANTPGGVDGEFGTE